MNKIWIFGAGETGRLFYKYISAIPHCYVVGFIVEDQFYNPEAHGKQVLSYTDWRNRSWHDENTLVIIAITGRPKIKRRIYDMLKTDNHKLFTYIHPSAFVDTDVNIGEGCFIFENNVIQSQVNIGVNTILWSGNHIGHQTTIGNHCFISSHVVLCGGVRVGNECFFGVNSAVAPSVKISDRATIGMGACILRDVNEGEVIKGKDSRDV